MMKRISPYLFSLIIFLLSSRIFATETWREHSYDVQHYRIDLRFDVEKGLVFGSTSIIIKSLRNNLNHISLDAREFDVNALLLNGQAVDTFTVTQNSIDIQLGKRFNRDSSFQVTVSYQCQPERGLYFSRPGSANPDQSLQVWSQGEGQDNHFWFPCYDAPNDKATMEMSVEVDSGLTAVSNGVLAGQIERHGKNIFYYRFDQPTPAYLISLIVGKYVRYEQKYKNIPVEYFVYPRYTKEDVLRSFGRTPDMLAFFSQYTGFDYPYPKYAQTLISDFMYSGMENISATTLTDRTMHDKRAHLDFESDGLMAHELAHQWFGDLVTCRDWDDTWLNEGFATYFTDLYYERWKGEKEFRYRVWRRDQSRVIRAEMQKPRMLSAKHPWGVYIKGASVLHMLRTYLGDDLFRVGVKIYLRRHAFGNAETSDLRQALEDASGYNLYNFFQQWVYGAGIPRFKVRAEYRASKDSLVLHIRQVQDSASVRPVFKVHLKVGVKAGRRYREFPLYINERKQTVALHVGRKPKMIVFDAGQNILKTLDFDQPYARWLEQYRHAPNLADRLQAVEYLLSDSSKANYRLFVKALFQTIANPKSFYGLRLESLNALSKLHGSGMIPAKKKITAALLKALKREDNAKVRRQLITTAGLYAAKEDAKIIGRYFKNDSSYAVQAAALDALCRVDRSGAFSYITQGLQKDSYDEQIRAAALRCLRYVPDSLALNTAKSYVFYGTHPRLRYEAVRAISALAKKNNEQAKQLLLAVISERREQNRYRPLSLAIRTLTELKDLRLRPLVREISTEHVNRYLKSSAQWAFKKSVAWEEESGTPAKEK